MALPDEPWIVCAQMVSRRRLVAFLKIETQRHRDHRVQSVMALEDLHYTLSSVVPKICVVTPGVFVKIETQSRRERGVQAVFERVGPRIDTCH